MIKEPDTALAVKKQAERVMREHDNLPTKRLRKIDAEYGIPLGVCTKLMKQNITEANIEDYSRAWQRRMHKRIYPDGG